MASSDRKTAICVFAAICVLAAVVIAFIANYRQSEERAVHTTVEQAPVVAQPAAEPASLEPGESIIIPIEGPDMEEMRYLPETVTLVEDGRRSAFAHSPRLTKGTRRLEGIRKISDSAINGEFLAPRVSPDGLQVILIRPAFMGAYVMSTLGGEPQRIVDGNIRDARWTPDGRIEIVGHDGTSRIYGPDGMLEEVRSTEHASASVFAQDDVIFRRTSDGGSPEPLTGNEDRYFNPTPSPDGDSIVYQGLYTGLYMANADGSGEPIYLGQGTNPTWLPDGSGVVFDRTQDDGHHLIAGDLMLLERGSLELSNLTEGDENLIGQRPAPGPDGGTIVFEAEGDIYIGSIR